MKHIEGSKEFAEALKLKELVLIDFSAAWCAPCKALQPRLEAVAKLDASALHVFQVNVDAAANVTLSRKHSITVVPTLLFFRDGKLVDRVEGAPTAVELAKRLRAQGVA